MDVSDRSSGLRRTVLAVFLAVAVAACAPVMRSNGYAPTDIELAQIKVGSDTREVVAQTVGQPSSGGLLAEGAWYYVQSQYRERGIRAPLEVDRQVVAISFDKGGKVSNIERFGLADGKVVVLSQRVTDSNLKGVSVIRQLLGNLGRFDPSQFIRR